MTKMTTNTAPDGGDWPSLDDLKFLDNDADPGAALGMYSLPHPTPSYDVPPTHDIYGTDLLDRHEWRRSLFTQDFLCETCWKDTLNAIMDPLHEAVDFDTELKSVKHKQDNDPAEVEARRDEINGETIDYLGLFENTLHIDSHSHTLTIFLARVMMRIGWEVAVFYKERYGVARPVTRDPAGIKPIIRTPAHPSYPSAHSTQAHLAKHALWAVVNGNPQVHDQNGVEERLEEIANRVAVNREYAGVHYSADTVAGSTLALHVWDIAADRPAFKALIKAARAEWDRPIQSGLRFIDP